MRELISVASNGDGRSGKVRICAIYTEIDDKHGGQSAEEGGERERGVFNVHSEENRQTCRSVIANEIENESTRSLPLATQLWRVRTQW